jgi:hypothetical protein
MATLTLSKFEIQKEIHDLNIQIENNQRLMNDYRSLQTGDFNKEEIREENKSLIMERNQLLALI